MPVKKRFSDVLKRVRDSSRNSASAVTVLTSMDQSALNSIGVQSPVIEQVERLARVATQSQVGGIVCSPHELKHLRACLPSETKMVTLESSSRKCSWGSKSYDTCQ